MRRIVAAASAVTLVAVAFVGLSATPAIAVGGGSISGTVTAAAGGPLAGICVGAYTRGLDATLVVDTATAADGTYTLSGIPAGNVDVLFNGSSFCPNGTETNVVNQWYPNQLLESNATSFAVTDGVNTPNIDAVMAAGGTITGTVTAAAPPGAAISGICVAALVPGVDEILAASTSTIANGTYRLIGVPVGNVHVEFYASGFCPNGTASNFVVQWYNDQATSGTATAVSVTAGATHAGINAALQASGSISGTVTAANGGAPLDAICVAAYQTYVNGVAPQLITSTATIANGTYQLDGAPVGHVDVKFYSTGFCPGGSSSNFAMQWYNNKLLQSAADEVNVTASTTTPNIDAALLAGGTITGTVTQKVDGAPLDGICVAAFSTGTDEVVLASTGTFPNGTYVLDGIPAGNVRVRFNSEGFCPGGIVGNSVLQWFNGQPTIDAAQDVPITVGSTTPNINAVMVGATAFTITVNSGASASIGHGAQATLAESGLPALATGSVVFGSPGHANLCTATLPATSCLTSAALANGSYTPITAVYTSADTNFTGSTSTNNVSLTIVPNPTSFSITANGGASAAIVIGTQATLAESGLPALATGSVVFSSPGHANLCTATLPAPSCLTSAALALGGYTPISAVYTSGNTNNAGSTSTNTVSVTVSGAPTSFTISVNGGASASIVHGALATLGTGGLPVTATGSVVFGSASAPNLCTVVLPATSCQTSALLTAGTYSPITAVFTSGSTNFAGSTSTNAVSLTVSPIATAFTIKVNGAAAAAVEHGLKATLSESGLPAAATGTVVFGAPGHANLCTATLPASSCKTSAVLKVGSYSPISAVFTPGSVNFKGSTSTNRVTLKIVTEPGAPAGVHAAAPIAALGNKPLRKATVSWTTPKAAGGAPITGYVLTFGGKTKWVPATVHHYTFTGLKPGKYHFRVRAINKAGAGAWSARSNGIVIK